MLVDNDVYVNKYVADGSTASFSIAFPFLEASHIEVYTRGENGEDVLVDPSAYTITGAGIEEGGELTFNNTPSSGTVIAIVRNVPITQLYAYTELDNFPAESHENALAKLTMIDQQQAEILGRALTVPHTSDKTPAEFSDEIFNTVTEAANYAQAAGESANAAADSAGDASGYADDAQEYAAAAAASAAEAETIVDGGITATGSTEIRLLSDRFADIRSVKDFGAKGDGVTDDSGALLAAFNAGGKILFEEGKTYLYSSRIYLPQGDIDIDLNGATLKSSTLLIFAPSDATTTTVYNGLSNIHIHHGTILGGSIGLFHNRHVYIDHVTFLNSEGTHHIQCCASNNVHINDCYFKGLKVSTGNNPHYESINIDPCNHTAFPYYAAGSATYDGTKNKDVFITNCAWENGTGNYAYFDVAVGAHYDDGAGNLHDGVNIIGCSIRGCGQWAIRANSWKNSMVRNCFFEVKKFAFDLGYQQRAKNVAFTNSVIVKDYSVDSDAPIHFGPYRGDDISIGGIVCIDSSGTYSDPVNLDLYATKEAGQADLSIKPMRFWSIEPLRNNNIVNNNLGSADIVWAETWTGECDIKRVNPYLQFIETDVIRGRAVPSGSTGYQGIYFKDNNSVNFGDIIFHVQNSGSTPYGTLRIDHTGNTSGDSTHTLLFRETASSAWHFMPDTTDINLGGASKKWKEVFAVASTINTSDERLKSNIAAIPDAVLDAWGEVQWQQFQMIEAIEEKGAEHARLHNGLIAQRIASVFEAHGLDASRYGLFCYDEWEAEPASYDDGGNVVSQATPAGNQYSLRYTEALAMEAAYQRRRADRAEARISALERRLDEMETILTR